jgi:Fe-S oxidoreductase
MGVASKEKCLYWLQNISKWIETNKSKRNYFICKRKVVLFCDEFTNYYDVSVGIDAFELLTKLGYEVIFIDHEESGRAYISKVFLKKQKLLPIQT